MSHPAPFARSLSAVLILAGASLAQATASLPPGAPAALESITQAELRERAAFFASDELGGRFTSTPGQRLASEYVAKQLAALGFEPLGDEPADAATGARSFFQAWPVSRTRLDAERTSLGLAGKVHARGFGIIEAKGDAAVDAKGKLVFCEYGAPERLPERIAEGELPFVMLRTRSLAKIPVEAQFMQGLGLLGKAASIAGKLAERGAPCVVFGMLHDDSSLGDFINYCGITPDKPLVRYGNDRGMAAMVEGMRAAVPMMFLSRALTEEALAAVGQKVEGARFGAAAGGDFDPSAHVRIAVVEDEAEAWNVCGLLRGSDAKLAAEAIVISAHIDHMGTRMDGRIFHGADDNASGSASLCEVAEAFARGERPRRSVIVLSVAGEEEGLWGSKHWAEHPTWPIESVVANVNIDMIGRVADLSGADEISITPSYQHPKFSSIARHAAGLAASLGLGLTSGDKFYERSDHYNFAVRGIPVVFFCDGEHEDYHKVTDTADKLDYAKIERVARLAYWVGHEVANAATRPEEIGRQTGWHADDEREAESGGERRR